MTDWTTPIVEIQPTAEQPTTVETAWFKLQDGTDLTPDKLAELEKGNMLNADYTKKTQDLAEKEKNLAKKPNTKQDAPDMSAMLDEKLDARDAKSKFLTDNKLDAIPTETQEVMDKYPWMTPTEAYKLTPDGQHPANFTSPDANASPWRSAPSTGANQKITMESLSKLPQAEHRAMKKKIKSGEVVVEG